jgi:hypothetical protein
LRSHPQKFDPNQQILKAIQVDREKYKSACQSDLKTAINGLVAGHSLEQIGRDLASSSSVIKHWEERDHSSTLATAKTIQYVEQLWEEVQANPLYHQKIYHKYLRDMQRTYGHLPRNELDRLIANSALKFHSELLVESMLKYSLAAQVGDTNYALQILAEARQQKLLVQKPSKVEKIRTYEPQDLEYGN